MSLTINYNASAMNARNNLQRTDDSLSQSIQRLSTGYRINNASDDPAGLVISENMRAQISGLGTAISNSQSAVNMVKTAEGALTEVNSLLGSMRDLAVNAANTGATDSTALAADQAQIASAIQSLNNISSTTAFGNIKLLDGSGAKTATILDPSAVSSITAGSTGSIFGTNSGAVNITATAATKTTLAGAVKTYSAPTTDKIAADDTIYINGTKIGDFKNATDTVQNVIDAINAKQADTGVTASFDTDHIALTANNYGSASTITLSETAAGINEAGIMTTGSNASVTGVKFADASATVGAAGTISINGQTTAAFTSGTSTVQNVIDAINGLAGTGVTASFQNGHVALTSTNGKAITFSESANVIGSLVGTGGTDASISSITIGGSSDLLAGASSDQTFTAVGNTFTNKVGDKIILAAGSAGGTNVATLSGAAFNFQIGANSGQNASIAVNSTAANQLGTTAVSGQSVATIDVTTAQGAQDAIKILDSAIAQVSTQRANMGSFQKNVLESNINSLGVAKENVASSESAIRNTDMTTEMVNFTRNQIMEQAGVSILTQANQAPQQLLSLLKG